MCNYSKKFLAILLTLCMLASFVPFGAFAAEASAEVVGQQLMLGDDLTMHFYTKAENASTATISVGGIVRESYNIAQMSAGENGYDFSVNLAAAEMTEEIVLTVSDGANDILTKTYSVQEYAHYLLENNYTDETKALAREMLNYGAKAQLYFGHNTGSLADAGYEMETSAAIGTEVPELEVNGNLSGISFYGAALVFKSKIAVRFYFSAEEGAEGYTFAVEGKNFTDGEKNGKYYIEIADINPDEMDTALNVSVTKNDQSLSFSYSPMTYIVRMYNKETSSQALKDMLKAANGYFAAAKVFTGVAENRTGSLNFQYRYGTNNLIQVNTNLPSDTPCVNFTASDNGCSIDQSGNAYQWFGWAGMDNVDGTIVLTFHFGSAFEAGQTYVLPKGAVFGFTDGSKYVLDANYIFTFDGSSWTIITREEPITLAYRYGTGNLIQFNTNLPAEIPCANFLAGDNGCSLIQNGQNVGWVGMENVDGTIVLTFHFNASFEAGQSYIISAGSVFGFTDGSSYTLPNDVILYWDGTAWGTTAPITLAYRYGTNNLIQYNTNLPAETPCVNFLAGDNGCSLIQNGQNVGWVGMENVDGTIVLTFHFNTAFAYGESYTLSAGSVFGFTDSSSYKLYQDVTLYWDGNGWTAEEPVPETDVLDEGSFTGGEVITFADVPADFTNPDKIAEYKDLGFNTSLVTEDHIGSWGEGADRYYNVSVDTANAPEDSLNFQYRYGTNNLIQVNTNLPASTPIANFTADQNGCSIDQTGNTVQWVGWIGMADADGTIVLTFNFNKAFEAGQSYVLPKGAVFGFTDGNTYTLDADYTFTWDGTNWNMDASTLSFSLNSAAGKYIQLKTNIPTGLSYGDFLLGDTGKGNVILETSEGAQAVGWFSYSELSGAVYLTFNFNNYNKAGARYILKAGTSLKAGDKVYTTDRDYILTVNNAYLSVLENLDNAGLNVWIRNFTNKTGYFDADMTAILLQYKDVIDGFYMVDEAFQNSTLLNNAGQQNITTDFDALSADVVDWFNTNFAGKYFHANHVPISSYDHYGDALTAANADAYKQFLELYRAKFNDAVNASGSSVSFDNYPFVREQINGVYSGISEQYLQNALIAAQVAGNYDFGLCIQTFEASGKKIFGIESKRDITMPAEVSLQLYTGFAMGADVFEYFAYYSTDAFNSILNQDGSKRIYDIVKEGNEALCFADVVNSFAWNGIVTSAGSVNNHNGTAFSSVANMTLTNISNGVLDSYASTDDAIIGCFTKDSLNGYMVVNFNDPKAVTGNNTVTLTFEGCTRARVYTELDGVLTSEIVELTNGTYEAILAPGSGCFVIPA